MGDQLTLEELSRYTGEPEERLLDWRSRGILGRPMLDDTEVVRLVQLFLRRGIDLDAIEDFVKQGHLEGYRDILTDDRTGPQYSLAEAAEIVGVEFARVERIVEAAGMGGRGATISQGELELLRGWRLIIQLGVPEDALLQMARVFADSLNRVAEAEQRMFHFFVHQRLAAQGLTVDEIAKGAGAAAEQMRPLIEPALLFFHDRALKRAVREDMVMDLAELAGLVPKSDSPGQLHAAIAFADLSSFTPLVEAMGDDSAAHVLDRFSEIVRRSVAIWGGRVVKQIGDAFMLVFSEPRSAVACALEIETQAAKEPQFPAVRAGIHWGTVLYREGDYVGSNVNVASRIANEAERHQVLVTSDVRREAKELPGIEFVRLGKRKLKGLSGSFDLFEARSSAATAAERFIDPVCGMEMGAAEVAARLSLEGIERAFCSEACLRKFVASPEAYGG